MDGNVFWDKIVFQFFFTLEIEPVWDLENFEDFHKKNTLGPHQIRRNGSKIAQSNIINY